VIPREGVESVKRNTNIVFEGTICDPERGS